MLEHWRAGRRRCSATAAAAVNGKCPTECVRHYLEWGSLVGALQSTSSLENLGKSPSILFLLLFFWCGMR